MTLEEIERLRSLSHKERLEDIAQDMGRSVADIEAMAKPFYHEVEEFEEMVRAVIKKTLLDVRDAENGALGAQIVMAGMSHKLANLGFTLLGSSVKNVTMFDALGALLAKRSMDLVRKCMIQEGYGSNNEANN